jgi:hypothetical protein
MFEEHLKIVSMNISTVSKIIHTNNSLREILFRENKVIQQLQQSDENEHWAKLINNIPDEREWQIYDHCAVVTRLYAIYERFVEDLIAAWLENLPNIVNKYSDLEEKVKDTHQLGVGRLLLDLKKRRFEHLSINEVIQGLFNGVNDNEKYKLIPDAFLLHEQNLRREILDKVFADAGISNAWKWVDKHRKVKQFIEEVRGGQNTAEGELNELITYRNDAAHGSSVDDVLGTKELLELGDFVDILCQSLVELVNFQVILRQAEKGKAKEIGQITEWLKQRGAAIAKIKDITLAVGEKSFLVNETTSYCQLATIESIMINGILKDKVVITHEQDVGLKFDIDAKKGLRLYVIE